MHDHHGAQEGLEQSYHDILALAQEIAEKHRREESLKQQLAQGEHNYDALLSELRYAYEVIDRLVDNPKPMELGEVNPFEGRWARLGGEGEPTIHHSPEERKEYNARFRKQVANYVEEEMDGKKAGGPDQEAGQEEAGRGGHLHPVQGGGKPAGSAPSGR